MTLKMSKTWIGLIALPLVVGLYGQQDLQVAEKVAENSRALRQYSWTMRAEVLLNDQKGVGLFKMRYDLDGVIQLTPIGGNNEEAPPPPELLALAEAAFAYAQPRPIIMQAFVNRAEIWEGQGSGQGSVRIEGSAMMVADDSVTLIVENQEARKMEVRTSLDGQPIFITADYQTIPNGPTYVARLVALQPSRSLELKIENFDYIGNSPAPIRTAPPPKKATIVAGRSMRVRLAQPLSTKKNKTGEVFEAILDQDLSVDGETVIPRGARLNSTIVEAERSGRVRGRAKMVLTLTRLFVSDRVIPIETDRQTLEAGGSQGRDAKRIAGGAGLGALIGAIRDGKKGAAKGAARGAGLAGIITLVTRGNEVEVSAEQQFDFTLRLPIEVTSN